MRPSANVRAMGRPTTAPCAAPVAMVDNVRAVNVAGEGSGVGAVAGGVIGGVLGNQMGKRQQQDRHDRAGRHWRRGRQ